MKLHVDQTQIFLFARRQDESSRVVKRPVEEPMSTTLRKKIPADASIL